MAAADRFDPYTHGGHRELPKSLWAAAVVCVAGVLADRGYDSEPNGEVCSSLGALNIMRVRRRGVPVWGIRWGVWGRPPSVRLAHLL